MKNKLLVFLSASFLLLNFTSCGGASDSSSTSSAKTTKEPAKTAVQSGEAVVVAGEEWSQLRFDKVVKGSLKVTSKSNPEDLNGKSYAEDIDYVIDYQKGRIKRTATSSIPDYSKNGTYKMGEKEVNLDVVKNFHNAPFTVYVTYKFDNTADRGYDSILAKINEQNKTAKPSKLIEKIKAGGKLTYLVIGDSISTGAEADTLENAYFTRFAKYIESLNPNLKVEIVNKAVSGEASKSGVTRIFNALDTDKIQPDLITIAYGMNDQNIVGTDKTFTSVPDYVTNMKNMLTIVNEYCKTNPEVILVTSIPANIKWNLCSGKAPEFAKALAEYGQSAGLPVADCNTLAMQELAAGKTYADLLITNINHPGNYGHQLYYFALQSLVTAQDIK